MIMARKRKSTKGKLKFLIPSFKFSLPEEAQRYIFGVFFLVLAIIFSLSFFGKAGIAGRVLFNIFSSFIGKAVFILPLVLILSSFTVFFANYKGIFRPLALAVLVFIVGISGILETLLENEKTGGFVGYIFSWFFLKLFGFWVANIVLGGLIITGGLIFWHLLKQPSSEKIILQEEKKPSLIKRIFSPSFRVKKLSTTSLPDERTEKKIQEDSLKKKSQPDKLPISRERDYELPPINLLETARGRPSPGDIKNNSSIIKKTLESFEIPIEMSEINVGPTVTQYSLKPAEGIKLSKITSLSNDLALALASHPIRIEAPIPGKSLVGIEVPNKQRVFVRLRELIQDSQFQNSSSNLPFCLGQDVSGRALYADLAKMPHLLVAGSTGTGKTIFLNSLILSFLYRNSPEFLRLILIDPKRVEFTVYDGLPHLLCPPIVDSQRAINALKWLTEEMEERFKLLAKAKSRNISSYNEQALRNGAKNLPYIVLVIDELADLMFAKGREVESIIVRLAQMARAVGIHLVVATQRPSVEVITGLIKANITARVTFQVASQIDSRTVLDAAGAEKLLGLGDMLYLSAELIKPKRIQGSYVPEKEVKKVVRWIKSKAEEVLDEKQDLTIEENHLEQRLEEHLQKALNLSETGMEDSLLEEDTLYIEAQRVVIQNRRASASLLQRKLKVGYARAARLIDMLEERGVVGPSRGAKAREVYVQEASDKYPGGEGLGSQGENEGREDDDNWRQV